MRLLIVDDSVVFRSQIKAAVESVMMPQAIGVAQNGKIALQKLAQERYDVMTLDLEMPEMNGMEVLHEIKRLKLPVKTVVFAAQTARGAKGALEALRLGAVEVVAKPDGGASSLHEALEQVKQQLIPILRQFSQDQAPYPESSKSSERAANVDSTSIPSPASSVWQSKVLETFRPKVVVIGSSTGGPTALDTLFAKVRPPLSVPIFVVQHMPPIFTDSLAQRLQTITGVKAAEAKQGEQVEPNRIYVAPGDYHMGVVHGASGIVIKLDQGPKRCHVRPAVDVLFEDVASIYEHHVMGFILTGMGEDGMRGAKAIKTHGGGIMIQDKETSVVWGMPGAVHSAGAFDKMGSIEECSHMLTTFVLKNRV